MIHGASNCRDYFFQAMHSPLSLPTGHLRMECINIYASLKMQECLFLIYFLYCVTEQSLLLHPGLVVCGLNKSPCSDCWDQIKWIYYVTTQRDGWERTSLVWTASFIQQIWEHSFWVLRVRAKFCVPGTQILISKRSRFWFLSLVFG